jgi:hypothetical protein
MVLIKLHHLTVFCQQDVRLLRAHLPAACRPYSWRASCRFGGMSVLRLMTSVINLKQSYATCQTGCNTIWVACYAAAGAVAGTVTAGAATPAVILGCNGALGTCMAACWVATAGAGIAPTP